MLQSIQIKSKLGRLGDADETGYLNASCRCSANGSNPNVNDEHVSHGSTHSEIILPDNVIAKIDRITRIDKQLFLVALRQFFVK